MSRWNVTTPRPPSVLAFDHPPTDAELQAYQPPTPRSEITRR